MFVLIRKSLVSFLIYTIANNAFTSIFDQFLFCFILSVEFKSMGENVFEPGTYHLHHHYSYCYNQVSYYRANIDNHLSLVPARNKNKAYPSLINVIQFL